MLSIDDDLWLMDEPDDPADLLAMPEIKHASREPREPPEDEIGLRLLLERPEAISKKLWRLQVAA